MPDPYEVLKVAPTASDDEIKSAYRDLVKKYPPDGYADNPLADLAQEKLKEINEAYDDIQRRRSGRSTDSHSNSYGRARTNWNAAGHASHGGGAAYAGVRAAISRGDLAAAEAELDRMTDRGAEWHFLTGAVAYKKGWYDEAARCFQTAASMDPGNPEYVQALRNMQGGGQAWGGAQTGMNVGNCCTSLLCADCLCSCLGGRMCC